MKYLGIDFGAKRVGLAVSDDTGEMAFPYSVIQNDGSLVEQILKILEKEKVERIVMGESKDFKGNPNEIMGHIEKFVENLKKQSQIEIYFEPEFMTSAQAEHLQRRRRGSVSRLERREPKNKMIDASAATLILQSYLDRLQ